MLTFFFIVAALILGITAIKTATSSRYEVERLNGKLKELDAKLAQMELRFGADSAHSQPQDSAPVAEPATETSQTAAKDSRLQDRVAELPPKTAPEQTATLPQADATADNRAAEHDAPTQDNAQDNTQGDRTAPAAEVAPATIAASIAAAPPASPAISEPPAAKTPAAPAAKTTKTAKTAKKPLRIFDEAMGARWAVWIGGIALALGAMLLVKYSIEQGLFGPAVRIAMGGLMAALLLGLGEFARRRELKLDFTGLPQAHIPAVLTASGTVAAYATLYAAYALYGYVGPAAGFALLGLVSLGTLLAANLHGPWLAGLGLAGAYITPLLVATDKPQAWPLLTYLAFVSAAALNVSSRKDWGWLRDTALLGAIGWGLIYLLSAGPALNEAAIICFIAALSGLTLWFVIVHRNGLKPLPGKSYNTDWIGTRSLAAVAALAFGLWVQHDFSWPGALVMLAMAALLLLTAMQWTALVLLAPAAAIMTFLGFLIWAPQIVFGLIPFETLEISRFDFQATLLIFAIQFFLASVTASIWRRKSAIFAATGMGFAFSALILAFWVLVLFNKSVPMAISAFTLAAIASMAAGIALKRETGGHRDPMVLTSAVYAAGAAASLALGLVMLLEKGWLLIALAIAAFAVSWITTKREVRYLRSVAAGIGVLALIRLMQHPLVVGADVGTTPIFNWLLYGYGVPAAVFFAAAWMLRRQRDDRAVRIFEALSIVFGAAMAVLQIRHYMNDGDILAATYSLAEQGLMTALGLSLSVGLQRLNGTARSAVFSFASTAAGIVSFAGIALVHLLTLNPLVSGEPVGSGLIFNDLLLGYLVPAVLAGFVYWMSATGRPDEYRFAAGALSGLLAFFYITLEILVLFDGEYPAYASIGQIEWYVLVIAWLIFGFVVMRLAHLLRPQPLQRAAYFSALLLVALGVLGQVFWANPLLSGASIGSIPLFNQLLLGYLAPALLCAAIYRFCVAPDAPWVRHFIGLATGISGFAYVSLQILALHRGEFLAGHHLFASEWYSLTIVWLLIAGAALRWHGWLKHEELERSALIAAQGLIAVTLVGQLLAFNPLATGQSIGDIPLINELLKGYLLPALLCAAIYKFAVAQDAHRVRLFVGITTGLLGFAYVSLQVLALHRGEFLATDDLLAREWYSLTIVWLLIAGAILRWHASLHDKQLELIVSAASLALIAVAVIGQLTRYNPMLTGQSVGEGLIFNELMKGYLITALLCAALYHWNKRQLHERVRQAIGMGAGLLAFAYISLMVRSYFHGAVLTYGATTQGEWYSYSVAWLIFGVGLLAGGLWLRSLPLRAASAAIILLTVAKVFLFDLAALEGILRALSFIGLGGTLIAIGYVYQRLLFAPRQEPERPAAEDAA